MGIVIDFKFVQPEKVSGPIISKVSGSSISESWQPVKPLISVTFLPLCSLGIVIFPSKSPIYSDFKETDTLSSVKIL